MMCPETFLIFPTLEQHTHRDKVLSSHLLLMERQVSSITLFRMQVDSGGKKGNDCVQVSSIMMIISFITFNSSLMPLIEGLCSQIHVNLSSQVFRRNRLGTDDVGIDSPSL